MTFRPIRLLVSALALWAASGASGAALFPSDGATGVCPDTPLRLTFDGPVALGPGGRIRILDAADGSLVESIDVGAGPLTREIGGLPGFRYHPVIVSGNQASVFPSKPLGLGRTYEVAVDPGVFLSEGSPLPSPSRWRFTTRSRLPAAGTTALVVAADGTGDFCTVQGALDFVPDGNTVPTTILIRPGLYTEIVHVSGKNSLTIRGEDRRRTVIAYANNQKFNGGGGNPYSPAGAPSGSRGRGSGYHRGVFFADRVDGLVLSDLTIRNTTPEGGSQAEALILGSNRTPVSRAVVARVDLSSTQDTLQINGQAYVSDCRIEGDVDFLWGTGPCYFEGCELRAVRSGRYYTQIRNPATNHGYVFHRCTFDGAPGVSGNVLSRIEPIRFPHSEVVLIDCVLTEAVDPAGWLLEGPGDPSGLHFWEYDSRDPSGNPVGTGSRIAASRQLRLPEDAATIAAYADPVYVLGGGWDPRRIGGSGPVTAAGP
jgi:pectin methylesterase-like acyl-CoA thioesterase